ncbi:MAG: hypothetical protein GPOALKHO_000663 [Sodalis sp.]|nr:MAG: hypothetical protein GPOALKHO_000663 [Sodalis sp.]
MHQVIVEGCDVHGFCLVADGYLSRGGLLPFEIKYCWLQRDNFYRQNTSDTLLVIVSDDEARCFANIFRRRDVTLLKNDDAYTRCWLRPLEPNEWLSDVY